MRTAERASPGDGLWDQSAHTGCRARLFGLVQAGRSALQRGAPWPGGLDCRNRREDSQRYAVFTCIRTRRPCSAICCPRR